MKWQDNGKIKLLIVVGMRPGIIRLAAVINKCRKYVDVILAHTGRNYDYNLNGVSFPLKMNVDTRGSFTELLKTVNCGQVSVNVFKQGITKGQREDFIGEFSKKLRIVLPDDYWEHGFNVYGGGWVDTALFPNKDVHFYHKDVKLIRTEHGLHMCVDKPQSF